MAVIATRITMDRIKKSIMSTIVFKRLSTNDERRLGIPTDPEDDKAEPLMGASSQCAVDYASPNPKRKYNRPFLLSCPALIATVLLSLLLGALALTVITIASPAVTNALQTQSKKMVKPCGSTPSEARKAGCNFDVISFCWLPNECYDAELSQQFHRENQLEWFLDPNRTKPLDYNDIMTGEYTGLYVNWEYHLKHCTAMWKKMHRAVLGNGRVAVDGYIGVYVHTEHCEKMLLGDRSIEWDIINTRIAVKYPDCGV